MMYCVATIDNQHQHIFTGAKFPHYTEEGYFITIKKNKCSNKETNATEIYASHNGQTR